MKLESNYNYCYLHPKEILVGVCPLCLNQKLLILAAKQGLLSKSKSKSHSPPTPIITKLPPISTNNYTTNTKSKPSASSSLTAKLLALGSLGRRRKSHLHDFPDDLDTTSTSLEDDQSFISIKFGENGVPSWDKSTNNPPVSSSKVRLQHCSMSWGTSQTLVKDNTKNNISRGSIGNFHNNSKSVVEHAKPRVAALRWRKRIGQLLQVIRWKKRRKKGNVGGESSCNSSIKGERVMKMEVGKDDKGWIMRTFKMRTNS